MQGGNWLGSFTWGNRAETKGGRVGKGGEAIIGVGKGLKRLKRTEKLWAFPLFRAGIRGNALIVPTDVLLLAILHFVNISSEQLLLKRQIVRSQTQ